MAVADLNENKTNGLLDRNWEVNEKVEDSEYFFNNVFTTAHKMSCTTAVYSWCGNYLATGSSDTSMKVLDLSRAKTGNSEEKPLIRTFYDHTDRVNEVCFHPNTRVLASCSDDKTIKLFDLQRAANKKAFRYFQDSFPVLSIHFHPSGDFLISSSVDGQIRLYDVNSMKCFTQTNAEESASVLKVRFSLDGKYFFSCSEDGWIRVWDTQQGKIVHSIENPKKGYPFFSATLSKTENYLLSSGLDSNPMLWDLRNITEPVLKYEGTSQLNTPVHAQFSHEESLVMSGCEETGDLILWQTQTGNLLYRYPAWGRHMNAFENDKVCDMGLAVHPTEFGMLTFGGDDFRCRIWVGEKK